MKQLTHPNKSHPGTSGRKKLLKDAHNWKSYLDKETHDFFIALGNGNFSAGIRKARAILESDSLAGRQLMAMFGETIESAKKITTRKK